VIAKVTVVGYTAATSPETDSTLSPEAHSTLISVERVESVSGEVAAVYHRRKYCVLTAIN